MIVTAGTTIVFAPLPWRWNIRDFVAPPLRTRISAPRIINSAGRQLADLPKPEARWISVRSLFQPRDARCPFVKRSFL